MRRNVSIKPSTVNLVCRQVDLRLMAAGPAVKVRRMLEARRRDWEPSMPMHEALLKVEAPPRPRAPTNSLAISSLKTTKNVQLGKRANSERFATTQK